MNALLKKATSLETLIDALATIQSNRTSVEIETKSGIDYSDLPTFGGDEPAETTGVWSWDDSRLLVGSCIDDFEIVDRTE